MRKFSRLEEPDFLAGKSDLWGQSWEKQRAENPKAQFYWHKVDGEALNHKLLVPLKLQTQDHCSFCDNYPVSPPSIDTIEHFRPKARFPREAYSWRNLYFCCTYCQQKGDEFDDSALQPDAIDYEFERYFCWDYTLGTIEVNKQASLEDQARARFTIRFYRLNEGHPMLRRLQLRRRAQAKTDSLDEFAYRDYIGGPNQTSFKKS